MIKNSLTRYGCIARFFHWLTAGLVIVMLVLGFLMTGPWYNVHKLTGLLILTLTSLRVLWTLLNRYPSLPLSVSRLEKILARSTQGLLYLCLFAMPLSGWWMATSYGHPPMIGPIPLFMPGVAANSPWTGFANQVHDITAWIMISLITLHGLGAIKHALINKDSVLSSMLGGKSH